MKNTLRRMCLTFAAIACLATPLAASPIFTINTSTMANSVKASFFFGPGFGLFDVRGTSQLDVSNPGPIGSVFIFDPVFGADPDFLTPFGDPNYLGFGNDTMYVADPSFNQAVKLTFDLSSPIFDQSTLTLHAIGNIFFPNPPLSPTNAFLGGPLRFDFGLVNIKALSPTATLGTFQLQGVSEINTVPEPNELVLLGCGLAGLCAVVRFRKTARVQ